MVLQSQIESKIKSLNPTHVELINESHNHSVPKNSETHFKLLLVSNEFTNLNRVQRQRKVYELLDQELKGGVHALTMRLLTPEEYAKEQSSFESPACHGGSKR